jgi:hypothetical protein
MKAGRELDTLVAEKVMGLTRHDESYVAEGVGKVIRFVWRDGGGTCVYSGDMFLPHYSTNIADAWGVVERLVSTPGPNGDHHSVRVDYSGDAVVVIDENEDWQVSAIAETAPLAICLAALKAKGVTGEQHG